MKVFINCLIVLILGITVQAQPGIQKNGKLSDQEKSLLEKAELLFTEKNYKLAMPIYEKLLNDHPGDLRFKYLFSVCALCNPGSQQTSLNYLKEVAEKNKKASEITFYLAKAHFLNNDFDEALKLVDMYASGLKKPSEQEKKEIAQFITYCKNAKELIKKPVDVKITNMGSYINSSGSEYAPSLTDDESVIYYTYKGERSVGGLQNAFNEADKNGLYYEDVFMAKKEKGIWQHPFGISHLNNNNNEAVLSVSNDAQTLFLSMDTDGDADIYTSRMYKGIWTAPVKLRGEVNTMEWEDNCSLSPDGKTLFFASTRSGGFGGKDIYKASLLPNGDWGQVKNLGDKINTPLDDDAPFIHYDGKLLLFSSKGHNSMGGYDVFKTYFNSKDSSWSEPENMGYPINSPADETHYVLSPSGETGYYALGRGDGYGDLDLYTVEPGILGVKPVVAVVKGKINSEDNVPVNAEIIAEIPKSNTVFRTVRPNETNGNYRLTLPVGEDYRITWKIDGEIVKQEMLVTSKSDEYTQKVYDVNPIDKKEPLVEKENLVASISGRENLSGSMTAKENTLKAISEKENTVKNVARKESNSGISAKENTLAIATTKENRKSKGKEVAKSGVVFKIQVASGGISGKRKRNVLNEFGEMETMLVDEVDKYLLKEEYKTLDKAREMVEKVRDPFVQDAFVVGIYKGKRYHLFELRKMGLLISK